VVIISAKNDTEEVFREKLEKNFPDQHIETKKSVRLRRKAHVGIDKAVEADGSLWARQGKRLSASSARGS